VIDFEEYREIFDLSTGARDATAKKRIREYFERVRSKGVGYLLLGSLGVGCCNGPSFLLARKSAYEHRFGYINPGCVVWRILGQRVYTRRLEGA